MDFHIKIHQRQNQLIKTNDQPRKLNAFFTEGGGTRGTFAIGILEYLFEDNPYIKLADIDIFGGTSVGSYLNTALSLGFQKNDLLDFSKSIDISNLVDAKYLFMLTAARFLRQGYLYNDVGRDSMVRGILNFKFDNIIKHLQLIGTEVNVIVNVIDNASDLTFGHLRHLIKIYPKIYKHLIINVVDISRNQQIFMTTLEEKWDAIKLYDAMMASSAIPFVFKSSTLYYEAGTDTYTYQATATTTENKLIDGGVATNNPSDYFLINQDKFADYNLWLLKFTTKPNYVTVNGIMPLLYRLIDFLIGGQNVQNVTADLMHKIYNINCINLHSEAGTLTTYTQSEIQQCISDIYQKCLKGELFFGN